MFRSLCKFKGLIKLTRLDVLKSNANLLLKTIKINNFMHGALRSKDKFGNCHSSTVKKRGKSKNKTESRSEVRSSRMLCLKENFLYFYQ